MPRTEPVATKEIQIVYGGLSEILLKIVRNSLENWVKIEKTEWNSLEDCVRFP